MAITVVEILAAIMKNDEMRVDFHTITYRKSPQSCDDPHRHYHNPLSHPYSTGAPCNQDRFPPRTATPTHST